MHTVTADNQKRIRIPDAKPGQVYALESSHGGQQFILTLVEKTDVKAPRAKLVQKDGFLLIKTDKPLDMDALSEMLREIP